MRASDLIRELEKAVRRNPDIKVTIACPSDPDRYYGTTVREARIGRAEQRAPVRVIEGVTVKGFVTEPNEKTYRDTDDADWERAEDIEERRAFDPGASEADYAWEPVIILEPET